MACLVGGSPGFAKVLKFLVLIFGRLGSEMVLEPFKMCPSLPIADLKHVDLADLSVRPQLEPFWSP